MEGRATPLFSLQAYIRRKYNRTASWFFCLSLPIGPSRLKRLHTLAKAKLESALFNVSSFGLLLHPWPGSPICRDRGTFPAGYLRPSYQWRSPYNVVALRTGPLCRESLFHQQGRLRVCLSRPWRGMGVQTNRVGTRVVFHHFQGGIQLDLDST
ncbi:hypothetical protein AMATHDRAFT_43329 [Amanita thiersii Skay4041]|uniref:Uncharacterized protein n=1 Tax=Amanita thiersii Skay4041 TaxID=703135 RepID=A0A2A9NGE0_9AGAR|nr:hypothetical protein AMATHDRAFT_43329 [Amanita thiersii Skay4041]